MYIVWLVNISMHIDMWNLLGSVTGHSAPISCGECEFLGIL